MNDCSEIIQAIGYVISDEKKRQEQKTIVKWALGGGDPTGELWVQNSLGLILAHFTQLFS